MVVFVDDTASDEDGTEELAVVVPALVGESKEAEKDHRTKYGCPTLNLCGNMKGAVLDPEHLWNEVDTAEVVVRVRPAYPGRKREGSGVKINLECRYWRAAHKLHTGERHQTKIPTGSQRFV